jgi:uncharacterized protein YkwD
MRLHRILLALAVSLVIVVAAAPAASAGTTVTRATALRVAVIKRMNTVRKAHGLHALTVKTRLDRAGREHARNLANHGLFAHEWSTGAPFARWIQRYWPGPNYHGWTAGENLYWEGPATTAKRVVQAWLDSPPHRRNLLDPSWRGVGVGAMRMDAPSGDYDGVDTAFLVAAEYGHRRK